MLGGTALAGSMRSSGKVCDQRRRQQNRFVQRTELKNLEGPKAVAGAAQAHLKRAVWQWTGSQRSGDEDLNEESLELDCNCSAL